MCGLFYSGSGDRFLEQLLRLHQAIIALLRFVACGDRLGPPERLFDRTGSKMRRRFGHAPCSGVRLIRYSGRVP